MITKAIVDEVFKNNLVRVRIPLYNKIEGVQSSTPREELYSAPICTVPNFSYNVQKGDIVFVAFEENEIEHPVIIGFLNKNNILSKVDANVDDLDVKGTLSIKGEDISQQLQELKKEILEIKNNNPKYIEEIGTTECRLKSVDGNIDKFMLEYERWNDNTVTLKGNLHIDVTGVSIYELILNPVYKIIDTYMYIAIPSIDKAEITSSNDTVIYIRVDSEKVDAVITINCKYIGKE